MAQDYVTTECARLLQQKGFPLRKVYKDNGDRPLFYDLPKEHPDWSRCNAWYIPTLWEVQQWFRNECGIKILPRTEMRKEEYRVDIYDECRCFSPIGWYSSYEEALHEGIMEALKLCEIEHAKSVKSIRTESGIVENLRKRYGGEITLTELSEQLWLEEENLTKGESKDLFI